MRNVIEILISLVKNILFFILIISISVGIFYLLFLMYGVLIKWLSAPVALVIVVILMFAFIKTIEDTIW